MLYQESHTEELTPEAFRQPAEDFRGAPFWAWNCKLDRENIREQIHMMKDMGFGGFHIHVRTGMETPYLSEEYMEYVRYAMEEGEKYGLRSWLYDEDRWPSGSAGGTVTRNPKYRARYLLFTPRPYGIPPTGEEAGIRFAQGRGGNREENGELLAVYDVVLDESSNLQEYSIHENGTEAKGTLWYAYLETAVPNPWFNNQTYVNTLEDEAVRKFTAVTHERYSRCFHEKFGKEVLAVFTDEPQHVMMGCLKLASAEQDVFLPWTPTLPDTFREKYGYDIMGRLPELFWELPDGSAPAVRYRYHDHIAERFTHAFCDTLGNWCHDHSLMLTGHVMLEPTLESQTQAIGEAMRCYRSFDLPGIDMLCDRHEYNTAKQCQSVVRQNGAPGMLSELYGVTGWDYDFRGHKLQGDWQAALGVTLRVHHLIWMSMKGEAKRDYPASIGYQSPWWKKYGLVEDHFARVNAVMTRGVPHTSVGVIHPIESYWLHWGPQDKTSSARAELDGRFARLTELLLFGMLDFDFISEALLPEQAEKAIGVKDTSSDSVDLPGEECETAYKDRLFRVGCMKYRTVIVPGCETLRSTTVERLEQFQAAGGNLIFIGKCPWYIDGCMDDGTKERLHRLYSLAKKVEMEEDAVLKALEEDRFLEARMENGISANMLLHQIQQEGDCYWVFIAPGKNPVSPDVDEQNIITFAFKGDYAIEEYGTMTGEIRSLAVVYREGKTILKRKWCLHDSLLLRLQPVREEARRNAELRNAELKNAEFENAELRNTQQNMAQQYSEPQRNFEKVKIWLEEPNACLLDMAEYALDGEEYRPMEEILRLDNLCRRRAGLPERNRNVLQPYLIEPEIPSHHIHLRFTIMSEISLEEIHLAVEEACRTRILWNGGKVISAPDGWYVDRSIETVALPGLKRGENILELTVPLGRQTNTEWCYLLGDFGVRVEGTRKTLTNPVRELAFGDIVTQGLPFYTGNLTYEYQADTKGDFILKIPQYRGAALEVFMDGVSKGMVVFSPYECHVKGAEPGRHTIGITLYNTRQNGFGQLHHTPSVDFYQSPDSWRSKGDLWCYEYQFRKTGILISPEIYQ